MANYAETLLAVKDHIAAYTMLASEEVNRKLDELKALKAEVDRKAEAVATADAIEKLKAEADAYVEAKHAEMQIEAEKLVADWDALRRQEESLEKRIAFADDALASIDAEKREHEAAYAEKMDKLEAAMKELGEQKQAAKDAQKAADDQYELYAAKVADLNARLAAIQKVVS